MFDRDWKIGKLTMKNKYWKLERILNSGILRERDIREIVGTAIYWVEKFHTKKDDVKKNVKKKTLKTSSLRINFFIQMQIKFLLVSSIGLKKKKKKRNLYLEIKARNEIVFLWIPVNERRYANFKTNLNTGFLVFGEYSTWIYIKFETLSRPYFAFHDVSISSTLPSCSSRWIIQSKIIRNYFSIFGTKNIGVEKKNLIIE